MNIYFIPLAVLAICGYVAGSAEPSAAWGHLIIILSIVSLTGMVRQYKIGASIPLFILCCAFIYPRAIMLLSGTLDLFYGFRGTPRLPLWIAHFCASVSLFQIGYYISCPKNSSYFNTEEPFNERSSEFLQSWALDLLLLLAVLLTAGYIVKLGGLGALANNYSAELYQDIANESNGGASMLRNLAVYCLVSSLSIITAYSALSSSKDKLRWLLRIAVGIACSLTYIKREYLFEVTFIALTGAVVRGTLNSKILRGTMLAALGLLMVAMFFARSSSAELENIRGTWDFLDTPEYWIADQFAQVHHMGNNIIDGDKGELFLLMFAAPFMDYTDYLPIDKILVEATTGITNWGIPGTIFSYLILSFGEIGALFTASFLGIVIGQLDGKMLHAIKSQRVWLAFLPLWMMFLWFLFRNGDPVSAVFATNRIALTIGVILIIIAPLSRQK